MTASARKISIPDEDAVAVAGGAIQWIPLRRRMGIQAFGAKFRSDDPDRGIEFFTGTVDR